jgi:hypothetical protein
MAFDAERLGAMAAIAACLPSRHGVQIEPVVGMDATGTNSSVVAVDALGFAVTARTKRAVGCGNPSVSLDPVGPVLRVVQPAWRQKLPMLELRTQATTCDRQMTRRTLSARFAARRLRRLMAAQATAHPGQLSTRCDVGVLNRAVTLCAADVATRVRCMVELQIRRRNVGAFDAIAVLRPIADVTKLTAAEPFAARILDARAVVVLAAVAAVAARRVRQQPIGASATPRG